MAGSEVVLGDYSVVLHADMLLGSGAYGDVYRGEHAASGRPVAVKRINARKVSIDFMEQEVAAIRCASGHENVVSLLHHELQRGFMYLVVEMCKAGDMQEYFSQNEVRDVEAGRLLQDCVAAIHHLHTRMPAIAHRDIKPQNYLVTYIDGISRVKACDFGLSRMVPDETLFGLTTACGSPHYMAPELYWERVHYNTPVDIYALGMLLWAIDHRELRQPLRALTRGLQGLGLAWFMKGAKWNPFPQDASSDTPISALAKRMMCFDPDDRPNIVSVQRAVQDIVRDMDEHRREAEGLRREVRTLRVEQLARGVAALDICPSSSPASTVPRTPAIISTAPRLTLVKRQKLPVKADWRIGISVTGFCLEHGPEFTKWDGTSVSEISRVKRPGNVRAESDKYQLSDGRWAVRDNNTTYLLSEDMASITGTYNGDYGYLRGAVHDGLLYVKMVDREKFNISILSPDHAHLSTLPGTVGGDRVSVCCHPSGHFAVTCSSGNTLDIYSSPTSPPRRIQLGYQPWLLNGVTTAKDAIIVDRFHPLELYVYDWGGRQLGQLTKGDLRVKEECIWAIGRVGEDWLMVAAGELLNVTALYVYSLT